MIAAIRLRARRLLARYLPASIKRAIRRIVPYRPRRLPPRAEPAIRRFDLRLPMTPSGDSTSVAATGIAADGVPPEPVGQTVRIEAPGGLYVPRLLEEAGLAGYEPDALACLLAAIDELDARTVFDIGANVGVFSVLAAAVTSADVTAFEPTPDIAATCADIMRANHLRGRVEAIALGASDGRATLYLSGSTDSSNSLRAGFRRSVGTVDVPLERLDSYCARRGTWPDVLKIDTESTEPDVLRGALDLLVTRRPWIICEVLAGRTEEALMELLRPLDYHWFHITDAVPAVRMDEIVGDPTYRHMDWLFSPVPPSAAFWARVAMWRASLAECTP